MINFGGLASGLDTGYIIEAMLEARRRPIYALEKKKSDYNLQSTALAGVESRLSDLLSAIQSLDSNREFASLSAVSSDEDYLTASAGPLATQGSFDVTVNALAYAQKSMTQGYDTASDSIGTGTFSITVGGETTDITVIEGASGLGDLATAINNSSAGVTATVLFDGSETGGFHLVISAEDTGTENAFTLDASGLSGGTGPTFTTTQDASNAEFVIDTLTVTSQTNEVANAIQGVTLNLEQADVATTVRLDIDVDGEALQEKVQVFVDSYNALFGYINEQSADGAALRGDSLVRSVGSRVRMALTSSLSGADISTLYQIGIRQQEDGILSFDSAVFQEQVAEDYTGVRDLFIGTDTHEGIVYMLGLSLDDMTDSSQGMFKLRRDGLTDRIEHIDDRIERYERSLESYELTLTRKFTAMEQMISALQAQGGYLTN
ncbi:flagellar filament capping protein FliD [bacterium]|nr:flagellar filament capping protein FliD [bacterium]